MSDSPEVRKSYSATNSPHQTWRGEFVREIRVVAAVKWYENNVISQGKAAEIARLSRTEFINALNQFKVSLLQYSTDEIVEEVTRC